MIVFGIIIFTIINYKKCQITFDLLPAYSFTSLKNNTETSIQSKDLINSDALQYFKYFRPKFFYIEIRLGLIYSNLRLNAESSVPTLFVDNIEDFNASQFEIKYYEETSSECLVADQKVGEKCYFYFWRNNSAIKSSIASTRFQSSSKDFGLFDILIEQSDTEVEEIGDVKINGKLGIGSPEIEGLYKSSFLELMIGNEKAQKNIILSCFSQNKSFVVFGFDARIINQSKLGIFQRLELTSLYTIQMKGEMAILGNDIIIPYLFQITINLSHPFIYCDYEFVNMVSSALYRHYCLTKDLHYTKFCQSHEKMFIGEEVEITLAEFQNIMEIIEPIQFQILKSISLVRVNLEIKNYYFLCENQENFDILEVKGNNNTIVKICSTIRMKPYSNLTFSGIELGVSAFEEKAILIDNEAGEIGFSNNFDCQSLYSDVRTSKSDIYEVNNILFSSFSLLLTIIIIFLSINKCHKLSSDEIDIVIEEEEMDASLGSSRISNR